MSTPPPAHPLRLAGELDPDVSRWLWLFKWLLVIPHLIVLCFLFVGLAVTTVVAGVAILFTARYPQALFRFNSGVLRWAWRVGFYSYSALGTDRYPPFRLAADDDYPAQLELEYPAQLSRGLVLVKWLLAAPHYLVVGVFAGFGWAELSGNYNGSGRYDFSGGGLIGLLVLFAGIALLFTGRYPRSLYGFVLGMNRWVFRVAAYCLLLTDVYPPFRLDMGPDEPPASGAAAIAPPVPAPVA